jgi:glutathione S-transferase
MARSMAAEMHSSFAALRREHSMNIRRIFDAVPPSEAVAHDITRIMQLWAEARARHGGDGEFLFGSFSAADVMFAPVVTRFISCPSPALRRPICARSSPIRGCRNGSAARRRRIG